jgi:hypothetical protein
MDELQTLKKVGKARAVGISVPDHRHDMVISLVESVLNGLGADERQCADQRR